jgi:hypothetical protein
VLSIEQAWPISVKNFGKQGADHDSVDHHGEAFSSVGMASTILLRRAAAFLKQRPL